MTKHSISRKASASSSSMDPYEGDVPPLRVDGYNQTYIVRRDDGYSGTKFERKVMFRCGNWCYEGEVSFADLGNNSSITLSDVPRAIPILQKQQDKLKYLCPSSNIPRTSVYFEPSRLIYAAQTFSSSELCSEHTEIELEKWSAIFPWIKSDDESLRGSNRATSTYFELKASLPNEMNNIDFAASKTYFRGLVFITVYFEESFYIMIQDGEGNQPLLDVKFPDISAHGQGLHIQTYIDPLLPWKKLTLWHCISSRISYSNLKLTAMPQPKRHQSLSNSNYTQTYIIMKPNENLQLDARRRREVFFRFGSWCYGGAINLIPTLSICDLPNLIPVLRLQQSRLDFQYDINSIPLKSTYYKPLAYFERIFPILVQEVVESEIVLTGLIKALTDMGFGDSITQWFEGDSSRTFFEFTVADKGINDSLSEFKDVDIIASKSYTAEGVVLITIWFQGTFYVVLMDGSQEQPLLDSTFPDISNRGRGYQVRYTPSGREDWVSLRKVTVWQTALTLEPQKVPNMNQTNPETSPEATIEQKPIANTASASNNLVEMYDEDTLTPIAEAKSTLLLEKDIEINLNSSQTLDTDTSKCSENIICKPSFEKTKQINDLDAVKIHDFEDEQFKCAPYKQSSVQYSNHPARPLTKTYVAPPHHLKPLNEDGLAVRLEKLRSEMGSGRSQAPWDDSGKPVDSCNYK